MPFLYYAAVWVASILLTEALRPKPEQNDPDPLDPADISLPQADEGGAVGISYGTCELTGPTILDAWDLDVRRVTEEMDTGLFSSTEVFKYDEVKDIYLKNQNKNWHFETVDEGSHGLIYNENGKEVLSSLLEKLIK